MHPGIGVAAVLAAVGVAAAPAGAATAQPIAPGGAYEVIGQLEDQGYVNIDRVGNAPINQCIVTSVRNPQDVTRTFWVGDKRGEHRRLITVVVRRYITVSLNCAR